MFVIGTAGHVDHGKSVLIKALTGIDPDRLREEKERGMTIDLGFAWLKLPSGLEVGVVDVPGHERFVRNMLAGVGGIDLALLVVAADEGVMPQTREHLAIIDLLDITTGIAVITKKDLVDDELLSLVKLEVEELIKPTSIAESPIVAVSAVSGEGMDDLISTVDRVLASAKPRKDMGRPRLMIDRIFTIAGSGTVVTGTLVDGSLKIGQEVEILPSGLKARLRGLQTHKSHIEVASAGSRVAANLSGVAPSQLERGDVMTSPGWLLPTKRLDAKLRLLPNIRYTLRHGTTVGFFTGAAEATAKLHLLERELLDPGAISWAQFALATPLAVVKGDHFIIRSPMDTLGGGVIVEARAVRHRRFREDFIKNLKVRSEGSPEDAVLATLDVSQPLGIDDLTVRCNLTSGETAAITDSLVKNRKAVVVGQGKQKLLFTLTGWEKLARKAEEVVKNYHKKYPTRPGISKSELGSKLKLSPTSVELEKLFEAGILVEDGSAVHLPSHRTQLSPEQEKKIAKFVDALNASPFSPPGDVSLEPELLNFLLGQKQVVKVSEGVVFSSTAYEAMVNKVTDHIKAKGRVTLAEVRDMLGTSRKYAQALLEYMDEKKITRRVGDERILR
ncbi:MAG TPA: selenocysteine-specific translation elongation factor [Dehalococcoidia bacterium]|jgi:selenocysteine-specific elongation factor